LQVTVPVLNPAHIVDPFAGFAAERVGVTGEVPTVQVQTVVQAVVEQPKVPSTLLDCTITEPVAPVVFMVAPLV
jgi:hypothetical protein